ncbi:MAG: tyrosine-protein kinase [Gammaproteobacteria bacterium HGW-Gammaproteobacteria-14]|nr:MAG: tyrosine-protein kinase [Gammaproteobacteria bacterium HGW-Gammaproteobacteria-14]
MSLTPIYRADAMLQVEKRQSGVPGFTELSKMLEQESSVAAETVILRSRMVLGEAVDTLGMTVLVRRSNPPLIGRFMIPPPAAEPGPLFAALVDAKADIRVTQFVVPAALEGAVFHLRAANQGYELMLGEQRVLAGSAGQLLSSADGRIALNLERFSLPADEVVELVKVSRLSRIATLRSGLAISEQGRGSGILNISFTGPSPERNRAILNAIADAYLVQNIRRLSAEAEKSLEFLEKQLPEIRANLEVAEDRLNSFRLESGAIDMSFETQQVLTRLVGLETKENELLFQEKELASLYTREHPAFLTLIQQQQTIRDEKEKLSEQVRELPETQQEVLRLTRDVQVNQEIYVQMLNKSQELRVMRAGTVGNVRIIDRAESTPGAIKPNKRLIVTLSLLLGLVVGVGIVLVRAVFRHGIETPDQIESTGLAVYATIPLSEQQNQISNVIASIKQHGDRSPEHRLLALSDSTDPAVEALRSLRTSLHFAMMDAGNRVLMISGPSPEVGKSFISANLAAVLSQIDRRVLLIDGDMRKGHLHKYFGQLSEEGLSNYLSGQMSLDQVISPQVLPNLDYMPRGKVPPNPAELLMHERFANLVSTVSAAYDLIIIDSPPVLAVTDAAIIGQYAGTSLMVARFGRNTVAELELSRQRFEQNGVTVKGAILNCMEKRAANSYGYYGYYHDRYTDK